MVPCSAITWMTAVAAVAALLRSVAAAQSSDPHWQASVASPRASGPQASANRCSSMRGSLPHTVAAKVVETP